MSFRKPTHYFWRFSILYGRILGRAWLAPFHHALLNLSLHGLGYDNCYGTDSGEAWFIREVLGKEDMQVCLDLGANVGSYSAALLDATASTVYAVEPSSTSYAALQERLKGYGNRAITVRKAVSDFDGSAPFFSAGPLSETATLGKEIASHGASREEVPVVRVDTLVRDLGIERIDFIKIDTEGFEREVLQGMQETLTSHAPKYIQFEFNLLQLTRGYTVYELARLLPGYRLYRLLPRGWVPADARTFKDNIFMYSNYVAVREESSRASVI